MEQPKRNELTFMGNRPICPRCKTKGKTKQMAKAGQGWSGTKQYKNYLCGGKSGCGYHCLNYNEPISEPEITLNPHAPLAENS